MYSKPLPPQTSKFKFVWKWWRLYFELSFWKCLFNTIDDDILFDCLFSRLWYWLITYYKLCLYQYVWLDCKHLLDLLWSNRSELSLCDGIMALLIICLQLPDLGGVLRTYTQCNMSCHAMLFTSRILLRFWCESVHLSFLRWHFL